jgi:hypothetical protein
VVVTTRPRRPGQPDRSAGRHTPAGGRGRDVAPREFGGADAGTGDDDDDDDGRPIARGDARDDGDDARSFVRARVRVVAL